MMNNNSDTKNYITKKNDCKNVNENNKTKYKREPRLKNAISKETKEDTAVVEDAVSKEVDYEAEKPIFFPLLFLLFLVVVNFLTSLLIFCNALILYQNNFVLIMAIYSFLIIWFMTRVDIIYFYKFKWRQWLFYFLYYGLFIFVYYFSFNYFMNYISSDESIQNHFIYTAFGATLVYTFDNFHMLIIFQVGLKLIIPLIGYIKEKICNRIYESKSAGMYFDEKSKLLFADMIKTIKTEIRNTRLRRYMLYNLYNIIDLKKERKRPGKKKTKKNKPIIIPTIGIVVFVSINMYVGVGICCNLVLLEPIVNMVLLILIAIFLFYYFMPLVDKCYLELFEWRKWIFYVLYYSVYVTTHIYLLRYYTENIKDNSEYFISQEYGASYSYVIQSYLVVIVFQIVLKVFRAIFLSGKITLFNIIIDNTSILKKRIKEYFACKSEVEEYIEEKNKNIEIMKIFDILNES